MSCVLRRQANTQVWSSFMWIPSSLASITLIPRFLQFFSNPHQHLPPPFPLVIPPSRFLLGYWSWTWFNQSCWWRKHFLLKRGKWKQRNASSVKVHLENNSPDFNQGVLQETAGVCLTQRVYFILNLWVKGRMFSVYNKKSLLHWHHLVFTIYVKVRDSFIVIFFFAGQIEKTI